MGAPAGTNFRVGGGRSDIAPLALLPQLERQLFNQQGNVEIRMGR